MEDNYKYNRAVKNIKMISKTELEKAALAKRLTVKNAERDYLLDVILFNLYGTIKNELAFKGGTCLYKLHSLNRFSEDLDFTLTKNKFDAEKIFQNVVQNAKFAGIHLRIKLVREFKKEINLGLECRGPLFDGRQDSLVFIPINISKREKIYNAQTSLVVSYYSEIPSYEVYALSLEEIFAEKIRALLTRNKPRDIYDIWFLLKKNVPINKDLIQKKLELYDIKFSIKGIHDKLNALAASWESDLANLVIGSAPNLETIKKDIIAAFKR